MTELKIFESPEFGQIRTLSFNGEPWFVGKDVAEKLGYQNGSRDVNRHVDDADRQRTMLFDGNQYRGAILINESGLYSLILGSKLESAKRFKRWVTSEVLPAIRKDGGYIAGTGGMSDAEIMAKALMVAQKTIERREAAIKQLEADTARMRPKELFADAVAASHTCILIGDLAKILRQNGVATGQKRLFEWLRESGYLVKRKGADWNMPTQRAMELGLFEVEESTVNNPDGSVRINRTTKVTGKGQQYFINKLMTG